MENAYPGLTLKVVVHCKFYMGMSSPLNRALFFDKLRIHFCVPRFFRKIETITCVGGGGSDHTPDQIPNRA